MEAKLSGSDATAAPVRPLPAVLNSPELKAWAEAALPKTLLISMAGRVWAVNAEGKVLLIKPPFLTAWHPPEADPPIAEPFDVLATIALWDEQRTPWTDFNMLHGMEALLAVMQT